MQQIGMISRRMIPSRAAMLAPMDGRPRFATTRWSLVQRAGRDDASGRRALDELCRIYWPAVYAYLRRSGADREVAADHTQSLFARLIERGDLATADAGRGRFRSWLKTCARNHAANLAAAEKARRRGGDVTFLHLDAPRLDDEETQLELADPRAETPERAFDRAWARAALDSALAELRRDHERRGRAELFDALRPFLEEGRSEAPYAALALRFDTSVGALKVAVHRMRRRFKELLIASVRDTLDSPDDTVDELDALFEVLR